MSKFNLYKTSDKRQYYWTLEADNGEIIATSETYVSKAGAQNGISAVKKAAPVATILDVSVYQ
ncbi:hypothetical protein ASF40_20275 [Microbacterium sp. Leaf288]|uniref:YegP family protein n=1 Tax=Microbacterium sp. Leaf288 TaxID=1736323 RepID=UPI0006F97200|nr:YegP family protein [Microbacterium sp. Leaf288]KQP67703.1 hypothetical protein ASF40_20275 [Microbacterium sp. Leaf288]